MSAAAAFSLVYVLAAAIALAAVATIWPRRKAPGGRPLALMLLAAAFWAVGDAIELHVSTVDGKRLVSQVQYIGVISAAPFFLHAAMELAGRARRLTRRCWWPCGPCRWRTRGRMDQPMAPLAVDGYPSTLGRPAV